MYTLSIPVTLLSLTTLLTSSLPSTIAQNTTNEPVDIGIYGIPHTSFIIAWEPTTTTTDEACNSHSSIATSSTFGASNPTCNYAFDLGDYTDIELLCTPDTVNDYQPDVTGVATADGSQILSCTATDGPEVECGGGASLIQQFACT